MPWYAIWTAICRGFAKRYAGMIAVQQVSHSIVPSAAVTGAIRVPRVSDVEMHRRLGGQALAPAA